VVPLSPLYRAQRLVGVKGAQALATTTYTSSAWLELGSTDAANVVRIRPRLRYSRQNDLWVRVPGMVLAWAANYSEPRTWPRSSKAKHTAERLPRLVSNGCHFGMGRTGARHARPGRQMGSIEQDSFCAPSS